MVIILLIYATIFFIENFKGGALASAISPRELLELLQSKDACSFDAGNVISEDDLKRLLDRSDMDGWDVKKNEKRIKTKEKRVSTDNKIFKVIENASAEDIIF